MVRVAPVSTFLIVTATSGRAAPVWFVTTPERLAPVWAHAGNAAIISHKSSLPEVKRGCRLKVMMSCKTDISAFPNAGQVRKRTDHQ
jgi:hypothetical protein